MATTETKATQLRQLWEGLPDVEREKYTVLVPYFGLLTMGDMTKMRPCEFVDAVAVEHRIIATSFVYNVLADRVARLGCDCGCGGRVEVEQIEHASTSPTPPS